MVRTVESRGLEGLRGRGRLTSLPGGGAEPVERCGGHGGHHHQPPEGGGPLGHPPGDRPLLSCPLHGHRGRPTVLRSGVHIIVWKIDREGCGSLDRCLEIFPFQAVSTGTADKL